MKSLRAQVPHTDLRLTLSVSTQPMPEAQRAIGRKVAGVLAPVGPSFGESGGSPMVWYNDSERDTVVGPNGLEPLTSTVSTLR